MTDSLYGSIVLFSGSGDNMACEHDVEYGLLAMWNVICAKDGAQSKLWGKIMGLPHCDGENGHEAARSVGSMGRKELHRYIGQMLYLYQQEALVWERSVLTKMWRSSKRSARG